MDAITKIDVADAFRGKLWAYTAIVDKDGYGLGIAVANEAGYSPVPKFFTQLKSYKDAVAMADSLNTERGLDKRTSIEITCSSMAAGKVVK